MLLNTKFLLSYIILIKIFIIYLKSSNLNLLVLRWKTLERILLKKTLSRVELRIIIWLICHLLIHFWSIPLILLVVILIVIWSKNTLFVIWEILKFVSRWRKLIWGCLGIHFPTWIILHRLTCIVALIRHVTLINVLLFIVGCIVLKRIFSLIYMRLILWKLCFCNIFY